MYLLGTLATCSDFIDRTDDKTDGPKINYAKMIPK